MDIEKIKKLAKKKADEQERRGTDTWNGLYYGYMFGYQDAISKLTNNDNASESNRTNSNISNSFSEILEYLREKDIDVNDYTDEEIIDLYLKRNK